MKRTFPTLPKGWRWEVVSHEEWREDATSDHRRTKPQRGEVCVPTHFARIVLRAVKEG